MPAKSMAISGVQCRMARAALGWSATEFAQKTGLGRRTIVRFETKEGQLTTANIRLIRLTFEEAGLEFLDSDGVRFRTAGNEKID